MNYIAEKKGSQLSSFSVGLRFNSSISVTFDFLRVRNYQAIFSAFLGVSEVTHTLTHSLFPYGPSTFLWVNLWQMVER